MEIGAIQMEGLHSTEPSAIFVSKVLLEHRHNHVLSMGAFMPQRQS